MVARFLGGIFCIAALSGATCVDAAARAHRVGQARAHVHRVHHVQRVREPTINYDYTVFGLDRREGIEESESSGGGDGAGSSGFGAAAIARETVDYPDNFKPGTIVISTQERRLYLVLGEGQALRYGIGVGRDGFAWTGTKKVTAKREWPSWTPPTEMLQRRPDLPRHMAGGPDNPLGARALYLGASLYRIHGSNEPETIGQAVSAGCFRMTNEDVIDLYNRVRVGTLVIVQD
jgi:lipoprotein-anchoring transpeptidase ErfK/SrfK